MLSLDQVLALLRKVRSLQFEATSAANTGWQGAGTGTVEVSEPGEGVVLFSETGSWQPRATERSRIGFRNVYRWTAVDQRLRLEHLRFGATAPVLLFDMAPGADGEWREVDPHQCREDCYTASLSVENGKLVLAWRVAGPQKQELIRYVYW